MFERVCDHCGNTFICVNPQNYLYVRESQDGKKLFYCCYEHWREDESKHLKKKYNTIYRRNRR